MAEAVTQQCAEVVDFTADGTYTKGDVIQWTDGRAGVVLQDCVSGDKVGVDLTYGAIYEVAKTTTMVMLPGSRLFWDHSANKAHLLEVADRDFFIGSCVKDAASNDTTVKVALNVKPVYKASLGGGFQTIMVQTAGFPHGLGAGEGFTGQFSLTAEAQKADALSFQKVSVTGLAECMAEALICVTVDPDAAAPDFNVGLANDTHASDADSITESLFIHLDGGSANIYAESDDGTTEVAATDTTLDYTVGTPFLAQWDLRNLSDIQLYINGVNVLPSSVFKLNAAAGPMKVLVHLEKTADDTPGDYTVIRAGIVHAQNLI